MKVILPKGCVPIGSEGPLFFLAGPVMGGGDWQSECCLLIGKRCPQCYVAIPNYYPPEHKMMQFVVKGEMCVFGRQLIWERNYLDLAAKQGCLLFWLPCESLIAPRSDGDPYATDTRREIGEWLGHLMHDCSLRVVIGMEANFPRAENIRECFKLGLGRKFPFYSTLEDVVRAAVEMAGRA